MLNPVVQLHAFDHLNLYGEKIDLYPHDEDNGATVQYYGYVSSCGKWIIEKRDASAVNPVTIRFACGKSAYSTAWTGRATLTYTYINLMGA